MTATSASAALLSAADHAEQQARTAARTARRIGNNQTNNAKDFDGGIYKGNDPNKLLFFPVYFPS